MLQSHHNRLHEWDWEAGNRNRENSIEIETSEAPIGVCGNEQFDGQVRPATTDASKVKTLYSPDQRW